ncbi:MULTISPECIES: DDE-type integrase/transposase/recombinase [Sphingobacterium]|uniref:DDE-type integrase/transposase/recombinase n=1 Tax=Sphingobacterium TaxID=28453 RepID=UPI0034D97B3C
MANVGYLLRRNNLWNKAQLNQKWSMDFMSDSLASGNRFRTFNVMDDCSREILCIEIATSISFLRVTRTLKQIIDWRGKPLCLRADKWSRIHQSSF